MAKLGRLPERTCVVLGDLSTGMVAGAYNALMGEGAFSFLVLDIQNIPVPEESFDLVVANHMLYHVPDMRRGVSELAHVLKPGGRLCATTIGFNHMRELAELVEKFKPGYRDMRGQARRFALENAVEILGHAFGDIKIYRYDQYLRHLRR